MCSILVIEDEQALLNALERSLNLFGHDVQVAVDGKDGIEKFEKSRFDVVITDINMPNMDGFGVARHIRKSRRPATPIIAITGAPWLVEGKADSFDKIIEKPFQLQSLDDTVKDLVNACVSSTSPFPDNRYSLKDACAK